jgi:hypothetical protein
MTTEDYLFLGGAWALGAVIGYSLKRLAKRRAARKAAAVTLTW